MMNGIVSHLEMLNSERSDGRKALKHVARRTNASDSSLLMFPFHLLETWYIEISSVNLTVDVM